MSLSTPTTKEISDGIVAQLEASLSQTIPLFGKAFARVLAPVIAGVAILLYKYASFLFLQLFVAHASMEETTVGGKKIRPLVEWGRLVGAGDPLAAIRTELVVNVPVKTQTGSLKAGSKLVRTSTGIIYEVAFDVALNASTVLAHIRATSSTTDPDSRGEGAIGNLSVGDVVSFISPYPNVGSDTTVASTAVQGADAEAPEDYRRRVILKFQRPPQGGAYADYVTWALEVDGIVNVYPYAGRPGEIDVFCEATVDSCGNVDGIPTSAQLTAVFASIQLNVAGVATRRPVSAAVNVRPILRSLFDLTVSGLSPNTLENQNKIIDGVDEHLRSREPYIVGISVLPRMDRVTQAAVSGIVDDIVNAAGASVTEVFLTPGPAHTLDPGQKAKLGTPTFIAF